MYMFVMHTFYGTFGVNSVCLYKENKT